MRKVFEGIMKIVIAFLVLGILLMIIAYVSQEKLVFFPEKLSKNHKFPFTSKFEEKSYVMKDSVKLHGLLFKADSSKGIVYYLHGNAGSTSGWGTVADIYTQHNYDLLIIDYRGYGKSEGKIVSEKQMYTDVQEVYNELKKDYSEDKIVVLGYSIGTGLASMLAAKNNPKHLVLLAPYYNFPDLVKQIYPIVPRFLIKYKFMSSIFIPEISAPVSIFHGTNDELIPHSCSERLYELCKPGDQLFLIDNAGHNGMDDNAEYQSELESVLN